MVLLGCSNNSYLSRKSDSASTPPPAIAIEIAAKAAPFPRSEAATVGAKLNAVPQNVTGELTGPVRPVVRTDKTVAETAPIAIAQGTFGIATILSMSVFISLLISIESSLFFIALPRSSGVLTVVIIPPPLPIRSSPPPTPYKGSLYITCSPSWAPMRKRRWMIPARFNQLKALRRTASRKVAAIGRHPHVRGGEAIVCVELYSVSNTISLGKPGPIARLPTQLIVFCQEPGWHVLRFIFQ